MFVFQVLGVAVARCAGEQELHGAAENLCTPRGGRQLSLLRLLPGDMVAGKKDRPLLPVSLMMCFTIFGNGPPAVVNGRLYNGKRKARKREECGRCVNLAIDTPNNDVRAAICCKYHVLPGLLKSYC